MAMQNISRYPSPKAHEGWPQGRKQQASCPLAVGLWHVASYLVTGLGDIVTSQLSTEFEISPRNGSS